MSVSSSDHSPEIQDQLSSQRCNLDFHKNLKRKMSKTAFNSPSKKTKKTQLFLLAFPKPKQC